MPAVTMTTTAVSVLKFVGTVGLGLYTGVSYSLSALSLPAILSLPSAKPAQHAFISLQQTSALQLRTLAAVSALSMNVAYMLSPRRAKHPYLLWTSMVALLGAGTDFLLGQATFEDEQDVNGEMVERAVMTTQKTEAIKTAIGLAGFAMSVIGIWGDGA